MPFSFSKLVEQLLINERLVDNLEIRAWVLVEVASLSHDSDFARFVQIAKNLGIY